MGRLVGSSVFPHSLASREQSRCLGGPMGQGCYGCQLESKLKDSRQGVWELVSLGYGSP